MITEEEKRQIRNAVIRGFDMHSLQHYQNLFDNARPRKNGAATEAEEDHFLRRRAIDIDSFMHVLSQRVKSKPITKHRSELVRMVVLSLANGSFTPQDLDDRGNGKDQSGGSGRYTDRQKQRLRRETYGDVFFEYGRKPDDGRVKRITSVFSGDEPPAVDRVRVHFNAIQEASWRQFDQGTRMRLGLNSFLRMAFPQFLDDAARFRDECREVFEGLGRSDERIDFLREELVEGAHLSTSLYSNVASILDLVWFRTRTKGEREGLLRTAREARYDREYARRARDTLIRDYGRDGAFHILTACGGAFVQYGRPSAALFLFEECAGIAGGDMERGGAWQNAAAAHRMEQNFKLALGAAREALACFEATGDAYRVCNALQLVGESQWRLGFKDAAMRTFEQVEKRGAGIEEGKRWRVQAILGMTFGRLGDMPRRKRHLVEALKMIPEEETENICRTNAMIDYEHPIYNDATLPHVLREQIDESMGDLYGIMRGGWTPADRSRPGGDSASMRGAKPGGDS